MGAIFSTLVRETSPKKIPCPCLAIGVQHLSGCAALWVRASFAYVEGSSMWMFHRARLRLLFAVEVDLFGLPQNRPISVDHSAEFSEQIRIVSGRHGAGNPPCPDRQPTIRREHFERRHDRLRKNQFCIRARL
jgi:hypothetical protein